MHFMCNGKIAAAFLQHLYQALILCAFAFSEHSERNHPSVATCTQSVVLVAELRLPTMAASEDSGYDWSEDELGFRQDVPDASSAHTVMNSIAAPVHDGNWAPSTESDLDEMPGLWNPFDDEAADHKADEAHHFPDWRCRDCSCPDWRRMGNEFSCVRCGSTRFYDAAWNYDWNPGRYEWKQTWKKPDDPWQPPDGEYAESETVTNDPEVNPITLQPMSRKQKKAARLQEQQERAQSKDVRHAASQSPTTPMPPLPRSSPRMSSSSDQKKANHWRDDMLKGLQDAVVSKNDKTKNWNIQQGPAPGVKYRGGTPPNPPPWNYGREDLRAFQKWTRKIEVWRIQIAAYLPPNEAAMLLYVSLKGEAEEELEWCDVALINNEKGIDYIIETLKQPLMTKAIYLKRRYLHEYDYVQRQQNETIRTFCNRYGRIERSLRSVQINVDGMYDSESRGARLLERMRLGLEQQRVILVAANQSLEFDTIREAAQVQFPDHRPTPAVVFMKEFEGNRYDGNDKGNNVRQTSTSKGNNAFTNQQPKGKGRGGRGNGQHAPRQRAYVTEVPEDDGGNNEEQAEPETAYDHEDGTAEQDEDHPDHDAGEQD